MTEKRFESCLYTPLGFVRDLNPVCKNDLQNLSIGFLNKISKAKFIAENVEVYAEELNKAYVDGEFCYTDTLYKVVIPLCDNMIAEANSKSSDGESGWQRIRESTLKRVMEYDSTVKLWDASRRYHPLFQDLPHTIFYEPNSTQYFKLNRLQVPMHAKMARHEFRRLIKTGSMNSMKPGAMNVLDDWNHNILIRSKLLRVLRIASNVTPKLALNSKVLSNLVRHSLKTELLEDIKSNAYKMGLVTSYQDLEFREAINLFQEPSERFVPLSFTTTYKTSLYAVVPKCITPACLLDTEDDQGCIQTDRAVEFNFVVQNLTTAWIKKYDRLHDWSHKTPIKNVLPQNMDRDKLVVKRNRSFWAKTIREEPVFMNESEMEQKWTGNRNFQEVKIETRGLRPRLNAIAGCLT